MYTEYSEKRVISDHHDIYLTSKDETFPYQMEAPGNPTILVDHITVSAERVSLEGCVKGIFRLRRERMGQTFFGSPEPLQDIMPEAVYRVTAGKFQQFQ
ncbi:MAG: hypothetical protein ABIR37_01560, partial [Candidatus Saccharimonadales bacterium]